MFKSVRLLIGLIVALILALGMAIPAFAQGPTTVTVGTNGQGQISGQVQSNGAKVTYQLNGPKDGNSDFEASVNYGPWGGTVVNSDLEATASGFHGDRANIVYKVNNDGDNGAGVRAGVTNGTVNLGGEVIMRDNNNDYLTWHGTQFNAGADATGKNILLNTYQWSKNTDDWGTLFTDTAFLPVYQDPLNTYVEGGGSSFGGRGTANIETDGNFVNDWGFVSAVDGSSTFKGSGEYITILNQNLILADAEDSSSFDGNNTTLNIYRYVTTPNNEFYFEP